MKFLAKLRQKINRDDGRYYRVGNRSVGTLEVVGLLTFIGALVLWQLHDKIGISSAWPLAVGAVGMLLAILGNDDNSADPHA